MSCLPAQEDAGKQPDFVPTAPGVSAFSALDEMREQLGDDAPVARFVANYLALLDQRIVEIGESIQRARRDECITRLLTLETSSHMVGADELSLRAAALRLAVGRDQADTGMLFAELTRSASSTRAWLASG